MELPLFPGSGLHQSLFPPVLIGLAVATYFSEALGWTYSGLVLSGYLAPIVIVKPWSFAAIVLEALLTYALAKCFDIFARRTGLAVPLFGRDRFYAILLLSVLSRLICEAWALDWIERLLDRLAGASFDYRGNLYGIGLVTVPLLANLFWKTGLRRGLFPVATILTITTIITAKILIPFTNYTLSSWELAYEDVAVDFLKSPRAYMIILIGAGLAHAATLRYGFDYGGILIPGLLALAWFEPTKVAATILEAVLLAALVRAILSLPALRTVTVEGPRLLLFVFSLGFLWKEILGFAVSAGGWSFSPVSIYGLGYLLPSLVAARIIQRGGVGFILRPLLQTSLSAAVLGVLLGVALETILPAPAKVEALPAGRPGGLLQGALAQATADTARMDEPAISPPSDFFSSRVAGGIAYLLHPGAARLLAASVEDRIRGVPSLGSIGYQVTTVSDLQRARPLIRIRPVKGNRFGRGILYLDPDAREPILVVAALSSRRPPFAPFAAFESIQARALLLYRQREGPATPPEFASAVLDWLGSGDRLRPLYVYEATRDRFLAADLARPLAGRVSTAIGLEPTPGGNRPRLDIRIETAASARVLSANQPEPLDDISPAPSPSPRARVGRDSLEVFRRAFLEPLLDEPTAGRIAFANWALGGVAYRLGRYRLPRGSCWLVAYPLEQDLGTFLLRIPLREGPALLVSTSPWTGLPEFAESINASAVAWFPRQGSRCVGGIQSRPDRIRTLTHLGIEEILFRGKATGLVEIGRRRVPHPVFSLPFEPLGVLRSPLLDRTAFHLQDRGFTDLAIRRDSSGSRSLKLARRLDGVETLKIILPKEASR